MRAGMPGYTLIPCLSIATLVFKRGGMSEDDAEGCLARSSGQHVPQPVGRLFGVRVDGLLLGVLTR